MDSVFCRGRLSDVIIWVSVQQRLPLSSFGNIVHTTGQLHGSMSILSLLPRPTNTLAFEVLGIDRNGSLDMSLPVVTADWEGSI